MIDKFSPPFNPSVDSVVLEDDWRQNSPVTGGLVKQNSRQWFKRFCAAAFQFRYYYVGDREPYIAES
jgi:hypothetical protein